MLPLAATRVRVFALLSLRAMCHMYPVEALGRVTMMFPPAALKVMMHCEVVTVVLVAMPVCTGQKFEFEPMICDPFQNMNVFAPGAAPSGAGVEPKCNCTTWSRVLMSTPAPTSWIWPPPLFAIFQR